MVYGFRVNTEDPLPLAKTMMADEVVLWHDFYVTRQRIVKSRHFHMTY